MDSSYINPAISTPDTYGLIPEGKVTPTIRRNLILVTKVLQVSDFYFNESQFMTEFIKWIGIYTKRTVHDLYE